MKFVISLMLALACTAANAECWVVSNLKGQSQFSPEYKIQKDEAVGKYHVTINGETASLSSVGDVYKTGLSYFPVSSKSMVGASYGEASAFIETWAIMADGKVIYTKTRSNPSHLNQLSSFIGDVIGKC